VRCDGCAPPLQFMRPVLTKATCQRAAGGTGSMLLVVLVIAAISRFLLSTGGDDGGSSGGYAGTEPNWDYDVTIGEIADPWLPEEGGHAAPTGSRLVAIKVTIAASEENASAYPTGTYDFTLTDHEDFAYAASDAGARPRFPEETELQPGEKVRGWVTFEVPEDAQGNFADVLREDSLTSRSSRERSLVRAMTLPLVRPSRYYWYAQIQGSQEGING